ncbi:MAG: hypothetical protein PWP27_1127 [Clostridiales bacterium]|jgi:uncharacterized membrane protein|nr:hypothetical protein [Clostridiales bacterium]MDK2933317.1 hypothetical protein [Clostridiales bacterium]
MIFDITPYLLLICGAVMGYKAEVIYKLIKGNNPDEKQLVVFKSIGLAITIISVLLIIYRK